MAADGSYPLNWPEQALMVIHFFTLDAMHTICQVLSVGPEGEILILKFKI